MHNEKKLMVQQKEQLTDGQEVYHFDPVSLLVVPHGGLLIHSEATVDDLIELDKHQRLTVSNTDLMDCEQIALGTYSPLRGFMDHEHLNAVLNNNRLPDGDVWTMPVLLQVDAASVRNFRVGQRIVLNSTVGLVHSLLDIAEIYNADKEEIAQKWFATNSKRHPGVVRFMDGGDTFIAGDVTLVERLPSKHRDYELSPAQTRLIFAQNGWSKVVGFHGRNPPHRAHEFIQTDSLVRTGADGLFISPVLGPKKRNDFLSGPIIDSYRLLLANGHYPEGKALLGSFATYSRYCGPREAVFTALCRKNMGCSHFIIGRDHTGVHDFYPPEANIALFDSLGDIGISPIFYGAVGYNEDLGRFEEERKGVPIESVSGTMIRETLLKGDRLPNWCMSGIVQDMLLNELASGRPLFCL